MNAQESSTRSRKRVALRWTAIATLGFLVAAPSLRAQTWSVPSGDGTWSNPVNWTPQTVPNAVGASILFASDQTANRTISVDGNFTVGEIVFDNSTAFSNTLRNNPGTVTPSLTLDAADAGPALITVYGANTGNAVPNTLSATMVWNDPVVITVNNTTAPSTAGGITFTGGITGAGGFTKQGVGVMTLATPAKQYTGPTVFETDSGRTRISAAGSPTQTSSVTVKTGSQLTLITAGDYTFGTSSLNLNGSGPTVGPHAGFPGVIRNNTNLVATIISPIVLESDSLIHVQGALSGVTTFANSVSGPGGLTVTAPNSDVDIGVLVLSGPGTFTGSTTINAGTLRAISTTGAALGSTSGVIIGTQAPAGGANGVLQLAASNQINDIAPMGLVGGTFDTGGFSESLGFLTVSVSSIVDLAAGNSILAFANSSLNFWSGTLSIFNWTGNPGFGTGTDQLYFGSDSAGLSADQLDNIIFYSDGGFTLAGTGEAMILGTGEVVAVPEPGAIAMLLGGFGTLLGFQRLRRRH